MATPPLSAEILKATLDCYKAAGGNVSQAARLAGVSRGTYKHRLAAVQMQVEREARPTPEPDTFTVKGDEATVIRITAHKITTLAQLVEVCAIDTAEWDVVSYECGVWETAMRPLSVSTPDGWKREVGEPLVAQQFKVTAKMKRRTPFLRSLDVLQADLLHDIRQEAGRSKLQAVRYQRAEADWLFEFPPVDIHFGKLTWTEETVTNYDTDIAEDLARASLEFLLERALKLTDGKVGRILYLIGNDAMHSDNRKAETTMGTRMDVDSRFAKVYRRLVRFTRWSLERLRQVAPVHGIVMPGNHDAESAFHLGELIAAKYEDAKHITIDSRLRPRKYYEWGINLWGFAHGHNERVSELPNLMAREVAGYLGPGAWDRCTSREWHIGHKHIAEKHEQRSAGRLDQDLFSDKGVRVRRLMSLSAHDFWHTEHGYADRRGCDGFVYHKTAGMTDHLMFNVEHFTGKPLEVK
jgi:hypothetical protein